MQADLHNGDLVTIYAITPRFENAVTLRGNVAQPGRFPWHEGMRVKDLIPRVDALISRHYWLHKNQTVGLDNTIAELLRRNQAAGVDIPVTDLLKKNEQSRQQEAEATLAESMRRTADRRRCRHRQFRCNRKRVGAAEIDRAGPGPECAG